MASLKRWLDLKRHPWKAPQHRNMKAWKADKAQQSILYAYDSLPERAVVLDIGGFEGGWSDIVLASCPTATIHIFEPHPVFAERLRSKYQGSADIHVHEFAMGHQPGRLPLSDAGDASTSFGSTGTQDYDAEIRPVSEFFQASGLGAVSLAKINIEGGEYDLLPGMIDSGVIGQIDRLQIQFHLFDPAWVAARDAIRDRLSETHTCNWCYPFVWEEWRLKT
ncbi:MAG: FkbM family methyltransferase [Rhodobacteraceae bacterium]|nr:FkbM family methyltransferase [Paracoccaceae bacterium]